MGSSDPYVKVSTQVQEKKFQTNPPVPRARALAFIDDIAVIFSPESARDTTVIAKVTSRPQERLALEEIQLIHIKSQALMAGSVALDDFSKIQYEDMEATQLAVVGSGIRMKGAPIGTEAF